jgi:hypothetical protein
MNKIIIKKNIMKRQKTFECKFKIYLYILRVIKPLIELKN